MCGILGSINIPTAKEYLHLIHHRGPNSNGNRSFSTGLHKVQLLHSRLSIVDLSEAGSQPMFTHNNSGCIIFNGEIYNHESIKKELNYILFNGHSDTETIVNYFEQFGVVDSLQKLNGIFALAYFDVTEQRLYLARDRYGVKPLYYYYKDDRLMFCSEIRPLKSYLDCGYDKGALINCLSMRYTPSPLTVYQEIQKVEPGQVLIFDLQAATVKMQKKYYVPVPQKVGNRTGETKQLVKEYGDLFVKAVNRQLMADVEVGILLSGGVDSALVAAVAKQNSNFPVKAFTIGFDDGKHEVDEVNNAAETAQVLGLDHYYKRIHFSDFLDSIQKVVDIVEEPLGTTSVIPMYELSRLAASKVKVVLSGQGADEPLGGYKKYRGLAVLEKMKSVSNFISLIKSLAPLYKSQEKLNRLFDAVQAKSLLDSYLAYSAILSNEQISSLVNENVHDEVLQQYSRKQDLFKKIWERRPTPELNFKDFFLYHDMRTSLPDDLLMYTDKITMHFSMECRVPILDNDLVDFIESLQASYKFNARKGKIIHKEFARAYLPASIIERKKLGFQSPTAPWFSTHRSHLERLFISGKNFCSLFNIKAVNNLIELHANGKNYEKQIFLLLSIFFLIEQNCYHEQNTTLRYSH